MPFISVLLPVHNRATSVARAVESVLAQSWRERELIVVDDGSTDGLAEVLAPYAGKIRLLTQQHAGPYAARNLALRHARGEFVAFIDSDDAWRPDHLSTLMPRFARPEVGLVFADAAVVTPSGPTGKTLFAITPPHRGRVAPFFASGNFVPTITTIVRRRCLQPFEEVPLAADYLAWFRVALRHEVDFVDAIVADYTVHPAGISYDLGRSLEARIALFSRELECTEDAAVRNIVRRVLLQLAFHLALAALRGRARNVTRPFSLAWRTSAVAMRGGNAGSMATFVLQHAWSRGRRFFS